jgi:hypothetical protein
LIVVIKEEISGWLALDRLRLGAVNACMLFVTVGASAPFIAWQTGSQHAVIRLAVGRSAIGKAFGRMTGAASFTGHKALVVPAEQLVVRGSMSAMAGKAHHSILLRFYQGGVQNGIEIGTSDRGYHALGIRGAAIGGVFPKAR